MQIVDPNFFDGRARKYTVYDRMTKGRGVNFGWIHRMFLDYRRKIILNNNQLGCDLEYIKILSSSAPVIIYKSSCSMLSTIINRLY